MTKQSYLRMIERNKERKEKKIKKLDRKMQKKFFKNLEKKIKRSPNGNDNFNPFGCCTMIPTCDLAKFTAKYPFLDFDFETKGNIVLFVKWKIKA